MTVERPNIIANLEFGQINNINLLLLCKGSGGCVGCLLVHFQE